MLSQPPQSEAARTPVPIGPATVGEIPALSELLHLRLPMFWMRRMPEPAFREFLARALESPRAVVLLARPPGAERPAGYVFALFDVARFWQGLALHHPRLALSIGYHHVRRTFELRREDERRVATGEADRRLPEFAWAPAGPRNARILGLYVRAEHRRKGIAMDLYLRLFDELAARGCTRVEEYMGADYPEFAGKFPERCGWRQQQCRSGGYRISRSL